MIIINRKIKKYLFAFLSVIVITIICGLVLLAYNLDKSSNAPVRISIKDSCIQIDGFNNEISKGNITIPIYAVRKVLYEKHPIELEYSDIGKRADGKIYGHEDIVNIGRAYCYIENDKNPYIYIETDNHKYVVNLLNQNQTLEAYSLLNAKINYKDKENNYS